ncbi:Tc toxin subunit A [Pseudomonas sp.]|uniref:Tc toxin subunit A n=1 Tax=Pseudomonas sp. TaxID=306 RepID=UPI003BB54CB4
MPEPRRPGLQLYTQLFAEETNARHEGLQSLKAYLEGGGSIFPLVEKGVQGMVREYGVSVEQAQRFLYRANSMATYLSRQFIERELHGGNAGQTPSQGLLSMVRGPRYEDMFSTRFDSMCLPQALESLASPVAYLIDLLRWIRDRIEPYRRGLEPQPDKFELHIRRQDLLALSVDFNAVYQSVSSVEIIVSVLESFIAAHEPTRGLAANASIEDALIQARYPNGLPYYQHWVTLDGVAQLNALSVGDFARRVDKGYPYFMATADWKENAGRALAHASRLGPYQRELLTEDAAEFESLEDFYRDNYGAIDVAASNLNQVQYFADHTKLDAPAIERLLSIHEFAPVRSANVDYPSVAPAQAESAHAGSVYLNAHDHPGIHIINHGEGPAFLHRLSVSPNDEDGLASFDRMNRMVRLCNWLALPSDQVDALLVAAIKAEERGGLPAGDWWITDNGVHALGLFQTLRERYNCSAADFAVFLDELGIYGRGEALSQFDQIFNSQGGYREPLRLDNGPFPVMPEPGVVDLTINQLCNGLGIDIQTYQYLAVQVASAHGVTGTFRRNLPIISSFYRLVRLPRLLNLTPVEGVLMLLQLSEGGEWLQALAGCPAIDAGESSEPDVLQIIDTLLACVQWCEQNELPVLWMLQHVSAPPPAREASEQDRQLFDQIRNLLPTAQFSNAGVLMAGLPPAGAASWLDFLTAEADAMAAVVDADGLVLAPVVTPEQYLIDVRKRLEWAVDNALGLRDEQTRTVMVDTLLGVLLEARDAQASLVKQTLAVYAGVEVEQAIPVLNWANTTVYRLLQAVNARGDSSADQSARRGDAEPDPLLALLAEVRRRSEVVSTLGLSAALLQEYLDYGYDAWMEQGDKYALSMQTLYHLTTLTRAFGMSTQPAQKLLDYLRAVNFAKPQGLHANRLVQQASAIRLAEFFGWSVQEVRECVERMDAAAPLLKDLTQLALLMRVRELSLDTGMDALTIFLIGHLPERVFKPDYAKAAELALLSESSPRAPIVQLPADLRQLVTTTCIVDKTEIVAGSTDHATFTVTVTDAGGAPLSGVTVHFRASLGQIQSGDTQPGGTFTARYTPGMEMGVDTPVYWLDLFEPQNAPAINLTCDLATLEFVTRLTSPLPLGDVARGEDVELHVTLKDRYNNLGKNEWVEWTFEGGQANESALIRPTRALTNQEGLARAFVSSTTGGTFRFRVNCERAGRSLLFDAITFEGGGTPQ